MLTQLTISDFAIIKHLEIDFKQGLNILSGETGAGKSIIINAVNLILGGRASSDLIRTGSNSARVEALFNLPNNSLLKELMSEMDYSFDGELLIKRTISREGRNRITINGSISTLQTLTRIGMMVISVSGQHEHQLLLKPENHLHFLDDFGGLDQERTRLSESFKRYETLKEKLHRLEREIKKEEERRELSLFQIKEIESANLMEGEDDTLEQERKRLRYAEQLREIIGESYQDLYEKEDSALSTITLCIRRMEKGTNMESRFESLIQVLTSTRSELEETGLQLRDMQDSVIIDPVRLEEVDDRIQQIKNLKRKYAPSIKEIIGLKEKLSSEIYDLDRKEKEFESIKRKLIDRGNDTVSKAKVLSTKRKLAAEEMEKAIEEEIHLLEMGGTRFHISFMKEGTDDDRSSESLIKDITPDGLDRIEFTLSPNVGEDLKPLSKIASGGELSRIMLALKTVLAKTASVETLIFDEVDSGIGGATAEVVGEKLDSLAAYHQILCITHLPQIASKGNTHFLVMKGVRDERTETYISALSKEERVNEIARLMGGKTISEKAVEHAREMLFSSTS
jgi:DNA repair protein RecN (Recombination protein N)